MYSFYQGRMKFGALQPVVQRTPTQINNTPAPTPTPAPTIDHTAIRNTKHGMDIKRSKPFPQDKHAKTVIKTNAIGDPLPTKTRLIQVGQSQQQQQQGTGVSVKNIARVNRKSN